MSETVPLGNEGIRAELRSRGLRATSARVTILAALRAAGTPCSHGEMRERLGGCDFDRTTVYRNLLDLSRVGLARRFDLGDRTWRFEAAAGTRRHPHFVCNSCGGIECLDGVDLNVVRTPAAPQALRAKAVEIQVRGLCDSCL